jgi:ABC-type Fe3+ transport system substrate-binding protein
VLFNQYGVIPIAGASNPEGARVFVAWITGTGQHLIRIYGEARFGRALFTPNARDCSR